MGGVERKRREPSRPVQSSASVQNREWAGLPATGPEKRPLTTPAARNSAGLASASWRKALNVDDLGWRSWAKRFGGKKFFIASGNFLSRVTDVTKGARKQPFPQ